MSQFNTNIDECNQRVSALEKQLGLPRSEFIDTLEAANARITELESKIGQPAAPATSPKAAAGGEQSIPHLKNRIFQLCESLGFRPEFQGERSCKTAGDYHTLIAKLEKRVQATQQKTEAPKAKVAAPFNPTLEHYRRGGTKGLAKAMGAAIELEEAQRN